MFFFLKSLDWQLNGAVIFIVATGLVSLASTSPALFQKQIGWLALGLFAAFLIVRFDWRPFINYRSVIFGLYLAGVFVLVLTLLFALPVRGSKSWLSIGDFQFQPSEFMKVVLIVLYAYYFSHRHKAIARVSNLIISFFYFAIPAGLVALEPDFGSVLILFAVWVGFLLVSGIRWLHLFAALIIFAIAAGAAWGVVLKDYQKERILGFFIPNRDPLGVNYNIIQSKISIGSAGLFGKGFGQGTQVQLGFLPERQTDFIFAAFTEEWGIFGGILLVIAFGFLIFRVVRIGLGTNNNFSRFVCLGAGVLFLAQFILNIGSALGLTPVIGVTFPFLSYGGSSLLTNFILIGIIQSVVARQ